eukprot:scaffold20.g7832.t1
MQADAARGVYSSTVQTVQAIVGQGGVSALWQGTQPTVIRLAFGAGIHFFFLETLRPILAAALPAAPRKDGAAVKGPTGQERLSAGAAALLGGLARTLAAVVTCPMTGAAREGGKWEGSHPSPCAAYLSRGDCAPTVVKTRMEYVAAHGVAGSHDYRGTTHALSSIARQEGLRGLYRGLGPTVLSNTPFSALYYMFYTRLQEKLGSGGGQRPGPAVNFISATVAATAATLLTQPADVVRTRMQLGMGAGLGMAGAAAAAPAGGPGSALRLAWQIAAVQGARGLLAGALPRVLKRTMQTALVWTIYEELYPRLSQASDWTGAHLRALPPAPPTQHQQRVQQRQQQEEQAALEPAAVAAAPPQHLGQCTRPGGAGQPRARALATARASSALAIADPLFELLPLEPPAFPELLTPGTHAVMLGIDPDISGAIAVLQWRNPPAAPGAVASANTSAPALDSLQLSVHDMPVELWEMGTRAKRQPSAQSLISLLQQHTGPDPGAGAGVVPAAPAAATAEPAAQPTAPEPPMVVRAVVEYSQPLSMSGKHAWYGNGFAMGLLHGLLVVMGVPYVRVHASTWKRQMGLYKQGKEGSLALASQAFPALAGTHLRRARALERERSERRP